MPQRGPLPSQRRSFAILFSAHASVLMAPLASTMASPSAERFKFVGRGNKGKPGALRDCGGGFRRVFGMGV